ncbi:PulJ/GspJ family protein [Colwellia sp. TT2012]|uniref:PulJ/GspJ family protein n=1 Tax=Colwellia sp. TT2012 TaxID=1720342 RepID=UPI00070F8C69|nr:prepilin-type N-terminal cleavage/methylation domain-containing protein [Colwellia sp. TT2012]
MRYLIKSLTKNLTKNSTKNLPLKKTSGFTLMELIIVIIIMGVMSVGIAGFINLSTQTYLNVIERDELLANARFAVERLNREVRNAVPNSMREKSNSITRCLEFVPIIASTIYTEIPVAPDAADQNIDVVPFELANGNDYRCDASSVSDPCNDVVIVYPLKKSEVYQAHNDNLGKAFQIRKYPAASDSELELLQKITFTEDSPTNRAYIFNSPVSYCLNGGTLKRYVGYAFQVTQALPPSIEGSLMAEGLDFSSSSFTVFEASLQRNAVVQIKLNFTRDGEQVVFDNAIHITNIP